MEFFCFERNEKCVDLWANRVTVEFIFLQHVSSIFNKCPILGRNKEKDKEKGFEANHTVGGGYAWLIV